MFPACIYPGRLCGLQNMEKGPIFIIDDDKDDLRKEADFFKACG